MGLIVFFQVVMSRITIFPIADFNFSRIHRIYNHFLQLIERSAAAPC